MKRNTWEIKSERAKWGMVWKRRVE